MTGCQRFVNAVTGFLHFSAGYPASLAAEIVENLEAALAQFRSVSLELAGEEGD